jgi:hypothetical protein
VFFGPDPSGWIVHGKGWSELRWRNDLGKVAEDNRRIINRRDHPMNYSRLAAISLAATAAIGLAACAPEQPKDYETDVVDESGGDLIVEDENAEGVEVKLPETPMTNVPDAQAATEAPAQ